VSNYTHKRLNRLLAWVTIAACAILANNTCVIQIHRQACQCVACLRLFHSTCPTCNARNTVSSFAAEDLATLDIHIDYAVDRKPTQPSGPLPVTAASLPVAAHGSVSAAFTLHRASVNKPVPRRPILEILSTTYLLI